MDVKAFISNQNELPKEFVHLKLSYGLTIMKNFWKTIFFSCLGTSSTLTVHYDIPLVKRHHTLHYSDQIQVVSMMRATSWLNRPMHVTHKSQV